jgi:hypothetical protein
MKKLLLTIFYCLIFTVAFFNLFTKINAWGSSVNGGTFVPYGPGNPEPTANLGVTGCSLDLNADACTAAVGTSPANMPDISGNGYAQGATVNTAGSVTLQNRYGSHYCYAGAGGSNGMIANQIMFPSALSVTLNSMSVYKVSMMKQQYGAYYWMLGNTGAPYFQLTNYSGTANLFFDQSYSSVTAARKNTNFPVVDGMRFSGVSCGPVSMVFVQNNQVFDTTASLPATVFSGGDLWDDNNNAGQGVAEDLYRFLVFNHQLSSSELAILKAHLAAEYNIDLRAPLVLATIGDSITANNTVTGKTWQQYLAEDLNQPAHIYSLGWGGKDLGFIQQQAVTTVQYVMSNSRNRAIILWGGTNNLSPNVDGQTAAQVYAAALTTCAYYRNTYNCKVFWPNILNGNGSNSVSVSNTNTLCSSAVSGLVKEHACDAIINVNPDTRITLSADGTHPNDAAQPFIAEDMAATINNFLFTYNGTGPDVQRGFPITFASGVAGPVTDYSVYGLTNPNVQVVFNQDGLLLGSETASVSMIGGSGTVSIFNFESSNATSSSVANVIITP